MMLWLHPSTASPKTPGERDALQRQIEATETQIDQVVHERYGLGGKRVDACCGRGYTMAEAAAVRRVGRGGLCG